jgi:hypothetical protein
MDVRRSLRRKCKRDRSSSRRDTVECCKISLDLRLLLGVLLCEVQRVRIGIVSLNIFFNGRRKGLRRL